MMVIVFLIIISQYMTIVASVENYQSVSFILSLINLFSLIISLELIIVGSSALILFREWIINKHKIGTLENATMQSESEQLKNQINPHVLFNMLNNANELTKENPKQAANIIFKLNDLLKYQISDSAKEDILLSADIQFLSDLLNLEKIRRDSFEFIVSVDGNIDDLKVPTHLFIPFVENALKHGNDKKSYIHLYFNVIENRLNFICINSKPSELQKGKKQSGGLGLTNIKRRLELLYGSNYILDINDNKITYNY